MCCIVSSDLIVSDQTTTQQIQIQILLILDWFTDVCDITYFQLKPADIKPLRKGENKEEDDRNLYMNEDKSVLLYIPMHQYEAD